MNWFVRPSGCGRTGWSWANAAALRVRELLQAMNTGHTGGGGTIHANAAAAMPARLAALGALGMSQDAVRLQVSSAVEAVVHVERTATGRQVASIGIMEAGESGLGVTVALEVLKDRVGFGRRGPSWRPGSGWLPERRTELPSGLGRTGPVRVRRFPEASAPEFWASRSAPS